MSLYRCLLAIVSSADVGTKLCAEGSSHYDEVLVVGRRCFLVKNTEVSWFLAREICEKAGAKLATIDRQEIQVGDRERQIDTDRDR